MKKKATNKTTKKPAAKRASSKQDFSQQALSAVEKLIGGKLRDGMKK